MLPFWMLALGVVPEVAGDPVPVVLGKELPKVTGPQAPSYPDPARGTLTGLAAKLRAGARRIGPLDATVIPSPPVNIQDTLKDPAGWKAYRLRVTPGQNVHARLRAAKEAWFVVKMVNVWGREEAGMLRNHIPTGNPEAFYRHPGGAARDLFLIVDTTESDVQETYTLEIRVTPASP